MADGPGPLPPGLDRGELVAEVSRALSPLPIGARALVAISGGGDSTALAYLVAEARPDLSLTLGHVRHGLRDDTRDLGVVREHARALGVELLVAEVNVTAAGEGVEAAARAQRYAALRRLAREVGSGWLLLAHTADDQAETLLMRLARGTGVGGLGGMAPVRGDLVRPLLRLRRNDLGRFLLFEGLAAVEDPTNRDPSVRRARARYETLPALRALGPDPVGALARLADLARADARYLEREAEDTARLLVWPYGPARAIPTSSLGALDAALAPRVVRRLLAAVRGTPLGISAAHVDRVLRLAPGEAADLPGARVTCGGGWTAFVPRGLLRSAPVDLVSPGVTRWKPAGVELVATTREGTPEGQLILALGQRWQPPAVAVDPRAVPPGGDPLLGQVVLGHATLEGPLVVRRRARGDRIALEGGTRKLQDALVDAGVPRAVRDLLPVVVSGARIVWVPGLAVDAEAATAGRADPALHLAVRAV